MAEAVGAWSALRLDRPPDALADAADLFQPARAFRRDNEEPLALAAPLLRGLAERRADQAFLLESIERGVHGAHDKVTAGRLGDEALDRDGVRGRIQGADREEGQLLEFSQAVASHDRWSHVTSAL